MHCDLPFPNDLSQEAFEELICIDSHLTTVATLTEADICNSILQGDNEGYLSSDKETKDEISQP